MKAPTADYSSLSQALSAKNNAIQTSYSAKDASNWKSSYDIQQKSFQLSRESLDLSEEQTNLSGALNMTNAVVNLVSKSAELYSTIKSAKQDEITQTLTQSSTALANEWQTQLQMNSDYMTDTVDPVTGGATIGLTEKGQKAFDSLMEQYFPSDTKYGWGMDDTASQLKESLQTSCLTYAQEQGLSNIQATADKIFEYNYSDALKADASNSFSGTGTEFIETDNGAGGTKTLELGKQAKAVIDARPYATDEWRTAMYEKAAQDLIDQRETLIKNAITQYYTEEGFITAPEMRAALDERINAHLDAIADPVERRTAEEGLKTATTTAVNTYFDNLYNTITDKNEKTYESMKEVYETDLNKGGKYYSLFFDEEGNPNPDITPSTYTSIKKKFNSYITAAEETGGTIATDQINSEFTAAKQKWEAGQYTAKEFGAEVERIMSVYDEVDANGNEIDWRVGSQASEAWKVYKNNLEEYIPKDILSDPEFENIWEATWKTALDADNIDYDDLTADEKSLAAEIKYAMSDSIMSYILNHPSSTVDKGEYIDTLKTISSNYTKDWADFVSSNPSKVTSWDSLTGGDLKNEFNREMNDFVDLYSSDFEGDITAEGYYSRAGSNLTIRVNDTVSNAIIALGNNLNAEGAGISDTAVADIKFKMNEDGTLYKEDGKPVIESIVWNGILNGTETDIVYDFEKKTWKKNVTGDNADNTVIEEQEKKEAEDTLAGGRQIEIIDNFLEDNSSPQIYDLISFLQDNCINEDEFDATLTILYNRYKEGTFMPGEKIGDYEDYMKSVSDTVVSSKGWEIKDRNVTTRAEYSEVEKHYTTHISSTGRTHGGLEPVRIVSEDENSDTEKVTTEPKATGTKGTQNAKNFLKKNKSVNQLSLLHTLLTWKKEGELEGAYEILRDAISDGSLIIQTGSAYVADKSKNPLEIFDEIYKQVK